MSKPHPMLDRVSQARLGEKLRSMYDGLSAEPVPASLRQLIGTLEQVRGDATVGTRARAESKGGLTRR